MLQADLAKHLDISTRKLRELRDEKSLDCDWSDVDSVRVAYIRHLREVAAGRASRQGSLDLTAERAALARTQQEKLAFELSIARGEFVPAGETEEALAALSSAIVQRFDAVPAKVAPIVAGLSTTAECEAVLREYIDESRNALAGHLASLDVPGAAIDVGDLEDAP